MLHTVMWTLYLFFLLDLANFSYTTDFWKQYVDYPRSTPKGGESHYCSWMMKQRGMISDKECEQFNTFIHEKNSTIENLCNRIPKFCKHPSRQLCHISPHPFNVSDCFVLRGSRPPNCKYWEDNDYRNIKVSCQNGLPSHLVS